MMLISRPHCIDAAAFAVDHSNSGRPGDTIMRLDNGRSLLRCIISLLLELLAYLAIDWRKRH